MCFTKQRGMGTPGGWWQQSGQTPPTAWDALPERLARVHTLAPSLPRCLIPLILSGKLGNRSLNDFPEVSRIQSDKHRRKPGWSGPRMHALHGCTLGQGCPTAPAGQIHLPPAYVRLGGGPLVAQLLEGLKTQLLGSQTLNICATWRFKGRVCRPCWSRE